MTTERELLFRRLGYVFLSIAILAEIAFLYRGIFAWMKMAWFKYPPDRFGPYVPAFFLIIFLYRLYENREVKLEGSRGGLIVILSGIIIFFVGYAADLHIIQAASLLITGFGMVFYLMGPEWAKIMLFPFSFLILMLPTTSFLIESIFGLPFRKLITLASGLVLGLTDSAWKIGNSMLYLNEIDLPITYYRQSISSPLALLIIIFIVAELMFRKNRHKFIFAILLWGPLFIAGHSVFTIIMGWTFKHGYADFSQAVWESRRWLPALIYIIILILIVTYVKLHEKFRGVKKNGKKQPA